MSLNEQNLVQANCVEKILEREDSPIAKPIPKETTADLKSSRRPSKETIPASRKRSKETTPEKILVPLDEPKAPMKSLVKSISFVVSPKNIMPLPHSNRKATTTRRRRGRIVVLTDSRLKQ
ncbi:hypothetical protein Trydic_g16765 [Trypoxylus dichotomus]